MQVRSSGIDEIHYLRKSQILTVHFRDGRTALYEGVSVDVWNDFKTAQSKGEFFNHNIRSNYPWRYL